MAAEAPASTPAIIETARAWLAQDPDPETQVQLRALINGASDGDAAAIADLHSRFDERLAFGTAGLRGAIAAGSNRMNRVLVSQAAAGLASYLLRHALPNATPSIVIGYDGRKNSHVFATDTAALMAGAGVRAILLPRLLPTPVLAFAVRHLNASCGVMVTASHNPPNDNGYKVYLGGDFEGAQIVAPADSLIATEILRVAADEFVPNLPRAAYETADEEVVQAYIGATAGLAHPPRSQVNAVYTALHGVGWDTTRRVLLQAGFDLPTLVDAQIAPDAAFPTVAFPNPEEPGAMDLAYETAREVGAELILANDPDADRLAVAIPDADSDAGYRRLSGNEVGAILGWRAAALAAPNYDPEADVANTGGLPTTDAPGTGGEAFAAAEDAAAAPRPTLACSIVSSPALAAIAASYGLGFTETLTGFKWVSRAPGLIFGFEEALGYLVNPDSVRDKDGISAAVALLSLVGDLKADGLTLADYLDRFSAKFGHYASSQISVRVTDVSDIARVMTRLRETPPDLIGRIRVDHIDDFRWGLNGLAPSDVLRIVLTDGSRVMVRPSGTEPKLKVYLDTHSNSGTIDERRRAADASLAELDRGMRALIA
ncbi:phospho-sugar mutase [Cryobacterium melibiosiphilum]|uniref:Phospho-sugar mutase n=1 Tax=Cryobacterium melibiosiphilum TaxID=995039 RepID=A0A3A5MQY9_9MICO|nr:phospho-sugar mutase [Cryobacterium melibiosiphilum]RJT87844.1 phospho-sugar mutase [Cryobacterium melibiosiphilum]